MTPKEKLAALQAARGITPLAQREKAGKGASKKEAQETKKAPEPAPAKKKAPAVEEVKKGAKKPAPAIEDMKKSKKAPEPAPAKKKAQVTEKAPTNFGSRTEPTNFQKLTTRLPKEVEKALKKHEVGIGFILLCPDGSAHLYAMEDSEGKIPGLSYRTGGSNPFPKEHRGE